MAHSVELFSWLLLLRHFNGDFRTRRIHVRSKIENQREKRKAKNANIRQQMFTGRSSRICSAKDSRSGIKDWVKCTAWAVDDAEMSWRDGVVSRSCRSQEILAGRFDSSPSVHPSPRRNGNWNGNWNWPGRQQITTRSRKETWAVAQCWHDRFSSSDGQPRLFYSIITTFDSINSDSIDAYMKNVIIKWRKNE